MRLGRLAASLLFAGLCALPAAARPPAALPAQHTGAACEAAAARAARRHDVPLPILRAIMLAESGRSDGRGGLRPWPWAVHAQGKGHWPDSLEKAAALARGLAASGVTNIDLGCFQVNLHWHGTAFASLEDMLDPEANADHAAAFLRRLWAEAGDWRVAAGRYHSRTPDRAEPYVQRLERIFAETQSATAPSPANPPPAATATAPPRHSHPRQAGGPLIDLRTRNRPLVTAQGARLP